jgi:hypothetical protein
VLLGWTSFGQNLIRNPGFEEGMSGWDSYSSWAPMTITTNFPHSGQRAALVYNRPNTYAGPSQSLLGRLQPGETCVCSGWTRLERGDNQPTKMSMRQIDASGTRWHGLAWGVAYSNRWTFISGTFTLNVNGTLSDLTLYFEEPAAGVDYLVDDVTVTTHQGPSIVTQPQSQIVFVGTNISLFVTATGTLPLSYQWRCNDTILPGQTDPVLMLPGVMPSTSGRYAVIVTNAFGAATSADAMIAVIGPAISSSGLRYANGIFMLECVFPGEGRLQLECSTNLTDWSVLQIRFASPRPIVFEDRSVANMVRFYRIRWEP